MTLIELESYFQLLLKYNISSFTYSKDGESFTVSGLSEKLEVKPPKENDETEDFEKIFLTAHRELNG